MKSIKSLNRAAPAFLLSLFWAICTMEASAQSNAPVEVVADQAEYDEASRTVTYSGNVVVTQAETWIRSSTLVVHEVGESGDGGQIIVAKGAPVRFRHLSDDDGKEVTGQSERAEYDLDKEVLTLIGNAKLNQEGDTVTSDKIVYDMKTQVARAGASAQGSERVRTVIQPKKQ
jgi:lipopolysaccharide export system protein LptA